MTQTVSLTLSIFLNSPFYVSLFIALGLVCPLFSSSLRCACVRAQSLSSVRLFVTPWTVAHQAPPSMEFSRKEYWSGLPFPSPGDVPNPGIEPRSPTLQADSVPPEPLEKVHFTDTPILNLCHPTHDNHLRISCRHHVPSPLKTSVCIS